MSFCFFTKTENKRAEKVFPWEGAVGTSEVGGGCGERVWESEYGANIVNTCM
jgi:hypothetical protein